MSPTSECPITAMHHDGFCLFVSALTDSKITNTPFRRDLVAELIAACQRHGMRIVLYYSQPDWASPELREPAGGLQGMARGAARSGTGLAQVPGK